jgi:hypothetical protein
LATERHQKRRSNTEAPNFSINSTKIRAETFLVETRTHLDVKHCATCERTAQHL